MGPAGESRHDTLVEDDEGAPTRLLCRGHSEIGEVAGLVAEAAAFPIHGISARLVDALRGLQDQK